MSDPMSWLARAAGEADAAVALKPRRRTDRTRTDHPMAWADDGACRGMEPELFYPDDYTYADEVTEICRTCPVVSPCLAWALRNEPNGWWGGHSERSRTRLRRALRIHLPNPDPQDAS